MMIRKAEISDINHLVHIENAVFPDDPWKESNFSYELESNPYAEIYLFEDDSSIAGFIDLWITFEQAQIANIGILPEKRRKHIGSDLLAFAINKAISENCETVSLEVRVSNSSAIALYEKFGFTIAGTRRHYYEDGEDAWLMVKPIGGIDV